MTGSLDTDRLFKTIDAMDADAFASFIAEDGTFRFGNADPVKGRETVRDAVAGFFASIAGIHHHDLETWGVRDGLAVSEGRVHYTRHDGRTVTVPFVNVYRLDGDLVADYRIYVDIAPLYAE